MSNQKTPTTILLTPDRKFHSFGYAARDFYHDLDPSESKQWLYLEKFKMKLHTTAVSTQGQHSEVHKEEADDHRGGSCCSSRRRPEGVLHGGWAQSKSSDNTLETLPVCLSVVHAPGCWSKCRQMMVLKKKKKP